MARVPLIRIKHKKDPKRTMLVNVDRFFKLEPERFRDWLPEGEAFESRAPQNEGPPLSSRTLKKKNEIESKIRGGGFPPPAGS